MDGNWYQLESAVLNEENDCNSHILNHCFPTIPKTKVDIHELSAVEQIFFDTPLLENNISDIEPNVSNKEEKLVQIPTLVMILYETICNTIITSK